MSEKKKVRLFESQSESEFEGFANAMIEDGYIMQSSSCGFINSENYNFNSIYQAIFILKDQANEQA